MGKMLTISMVFPTLAVSLAFAPQSAKAITYEVEIENFAFVPAGLHINVGDAIEWRNRDNVPHTATSDTGVWDSGVLSNDQRYTFVFTEAGNFPYHCSIHSSMKDTIMVEDPTAIDDNEPFAPDKFNLAQNYPNPFNAQTSINYSLSVPAQVKLSIYNLLGQEIETLVNTQQQPGEHSVIWDASDIPTGVYFYRIETPEFTATRKMLLAK